MQRVMGEGPVPGKGWNSGKCDFGACMQSDLSPLASYQKALGPPPWLPP